MSEHLTYLREVLEHDAIGFGEDFQFQDAVEHLEALEHASEQYRKAMSEQAKRIEQLEAALRTLIASCDNGAKMQKIGVSGMAVQTNIQSSWVNNVEAWAVNEARAALEGKDD